MTAQPEWLQQKLIEPQHLEEERAKLRARGLTLATLNGSFDLMHAGHLHIIHAASQQADRLLVALNSDASIQKYKSPNRPIIPLRFRLEMVAALEFVDYVTWFEETDPCALLDKIKPDVHVNGAEYGADCIESKTVKTHGGKLVLIDRIPSLATSAIIEKILQCAK
ncbi:MAG: adenylyltransferase/cytidyltransferase family protein [Verrucomicrobia bacterium]|nr:adenylyltransferase/cytidyltransferase family protein [Verrucomicrobiota bacterium]MBU6446001.1 adenylyltransferase/cytidyltransferase family protein [Verrucomicrobiota bacterium]MDE3047624.1 adenylyltransferase/cytidyltransferase family protein [Verrucomicrobiota bacterium]